MLDRHNGSSSDWTVDGAGCGRGFLGMVVVFVVLMAALVYAAMITPAAAQSPSTKTELNATISTNLADNTTGAITPAILRSVLVNMVSSWQQAGQVNAQTGTTYTILVGDYGKLVTFSNGSTVAVTLPQATTTFATFSTFVRNKGAGLVTITPTTSTINGAATLTLPTGQGTWIVSDGTNYQTFGLNIATTADWEANTTNKALTTDQVWAAGALVTLTVSGTTFTPLFGAGFNFSITLTTTGMTLANPTNVKAGQSGIIKIIQGGAGSNTITTYGNVYKFSGGIKPTLTTTVAAVDVMSYFCETTTSCYTSFQANMQ